mmetsp:Transcript_7835/g.12066  ORF Transcript_7835/g.12066 Transcript_7835/m.12066 type:complete len:125 (+) Transcript_7835:2-376(+)
MEDEHNEIHAGASVTGTLYECEDKARHPVVQLYTKEGCTLCDKVVDVLKDVLGDQPHSLQAIDIRDDNEVFSKYKYDIPVLHINNEYWTKHRLSADEALEGIQEARQGNFEAKQGEPNAAKYEH